MSYFLVIMRIFLVIITPMHMQSNGADGCGTAVRLGFSVASSLNVWVYSVLILTCMSWMRLFDVQVSLDTKKTPFMIYYM